MRRIPLWMVVVASTLIAAAVASATLLTGDDRSPTFDAAAQPWESVAGAAKGQRVRLWMWGGEAALNDYIDRDVTPAAAAAGVTLERVPIDDTSSAMERLIAEADAGTQSSAIDLLWVNGKNFAQGKQARLWLPDWVAVLPNAATLDPSDATLFTDFGVATDGQEMPWSRAAFVFAADTARTPSPRAALPSCSTTPAPTLAGLHIRRRPTSPVRPLCALPYKRSV